MGRVRLNVVMLLAAFSDPMREKRAEVSSVMVWGWVTLAGYVRMAMWWRHG